MVLRTNSRKWDDVIEKRYGFANLEQRARATLDTVYYIFTCQDSKPWDMGKEVAVLVEPAFAH